MEKKTLLYVVRYPLYEGFHLKQKFDGQLKAFENLGFGVYYIGFDKQHFYLISGEKKEIIGKTRFWIPNYFHTFLYVDLYRMAKEVIKEKTIAIVYYREAAKFQSLYRMVKEIKKHSAKLLYEIPTYLPNSEEKHLSFARKIFSIYGSIWEKKIKTLPDVYVFMGDGNFSTFNGTKAIRIENGISADLMPLRTPINKENEIHILALSSMCDWHGYDRLIRSMGEYRGSEKIIIHMVGGDDGHYMDAWRNLTEDLSLTDRVIFHGALYGNDLHQIFDLCDIGVNSLGMYRKGMDDTSELKTREYIARGLPFVCSVYDVVLDGLDKELWYKVTNDDTIPSMDEIVTFAKKMKSNSNVAMTLREHALKTMTWEAQYKKVFDRLEDEL